MFTVSPALQLVIGLPLKSVIDTTERPVLLTSDASQPKFLLLLVRIAAHEFDANGGVCGSPTAACATALSPSQPAAPNTHAAAVADSHDLAAAASVLNSPLPPTANKLQPE
jgi:hypothetical protein